MYKYHAQAPNMLSSGSSGSQPAKHIIIVVSPLNSLIKDQVNRLSSLGISAVALNDITSDSVKEKVLKGDFSVVFGSPELW